MSTKQKEPCINYVGAVLKSSYNPSNMWLIVKQVGDKMYLQDPKTNKKDDFGYSISNHIKSGYQFIFPQQIAVDKEYEDLLV